MAITQWIALLSTLCQLTAIRGAAIQTLVVLMMENHSYDHFLGFYSQIRPEADGSNPSMCNPFAGDAICVTHDGPFHTLEPENFIPDVDQQVYALSYGTMPSPSAQPTMQGFVANFMRYRPKESAAQVMRGMNQTTLPVLYKLVEEFGISDRWFSSVPGSTYPNRNFLHAATAGGVVTNDIPKLGYPLKTTFEALDDLHVSYGIYSASPLPSTLLFRYFRSPYRTAGKGMDDFYQHCKSGTLPSYVYVEPAMFGIDERLRNDQHPHAGSFYDLRRGERFYKDVYEALRASPQWNNTLFLLVWDEHGGFYDHVPPPENVPNPDGITHPTFDFTRLGIRVPAIFISPRIPRGFLAPRSHVFEHASVSSTIHALFGTPYLTRRDAASRPFHYYANLTEPRTDCVVTLPEPAYDL